MTLAVCLALLGCSSFAEAKGESRLGMKVDDFTLGDCYGKPVSLHDFSDRKLVVLAFLGTECPMVQFYAPRLSEIQSDFESDVAVIGINSNVQDSLTELQIFKKKHELDYPLLKDLRNRVADKLKAERTPEVFLLDHRGVVIYHGRINQEYSPGLKREGESRLDLRLAIDQALAGKKIEVPETVATGCHIGRIQEVEPVGEITYTKDIAPILNDRCVRCHREGEIAPFTLTSYEDVVGWEYTILEVIEDKRMPPWFANPSHGSFANDARLSDKERETLETWVDNGMPKGDLSDLPEPPVFADGWAIPEPDQIILMDDKPFSVPAEGVVDYQRFVVDPGWDEDKYIYAAEARPQNRAVVHHILAYVIPPGSRRPDLKRVVVGYAPGGDPIRLADGVAIHVPAGSKLLFEMHYTPNGTEQTDCSSIGVCFLDKEQVRKELRGEIAINGLRGKDMIPQGESNHKVQAVYTSKRDELLKSMTPHMHLRGKSFTYKAYFPDGSEKILLDVPKYDFNWQIKYILKEPIELKRGTRILCTAVYDNSENNPSLSREELARKYVWWGDQTNDEMMIGFMDMVAPD